jgi:transposase
MRNGTSRTRQEGCRGLHWKRCSPKVCAEQACGRRTFTQATDQLRARARCLTRLKAAVLGAVIGSGRAVEEVAAAFAVAWWTVQSVLNAAIMTLPDIDAVHEVHLGIDEHRFRTVRFFRDPHGAWLRSSRG